MDTGNIVQLMKKALMLVIHLHPNNKHHMAKLSFGGKSTQGDCEVVLECFASF